MVKMKKSDKRVIILIVVVFVLVLSSCAPRVEIPSSSNDSNANSEIVDSSTETLSEDSSGESESVTSSDSSTESETSKDISESVTSISESLEPTLTLKPSPTTIPKATPTMIPTVIPTPTKQINYQGIIVFRQPNSSSGFLTQNTIDMKAAFPSNTAIPEATPVIFTLGGKNYLTVPTAWTVVCGFDTNRTPESVWTSTFALSQNDWWILSDSLSGYGAGIAGIKPFPTTTEFNVESKWNPGEPYWARIYYSAFDVVPVIVNNKEYLFSVNHGENKNEKYYDGRMYANTIQPRPENGLYESYQYSGVTDGVYNDYPHGYFGFTGMSVIPSDDFKKGIKIDATSSYDKGPILWPSNGYVDANYNRVNSGVKHPSLFIEGNYVYVYYIDNDKVRVARSPVSSLGDPSSFRIYSNNSFSKSSLPAGFDKNSRNFFDKGISYPTAILGENSSSIRFSVAKIKNTPYYLGVEEYYTAWPQGGIRFRLSEDLVTWSSPFNIPGGEWPQNNYHNGTLHYPLIYNKDFTSRTEIDADEFYVVGQYGSNIGAPKTQAVKFEIEIR